MVALTQGDDTALHSGRLTLNPLPHLDPIGSVIFPFVCILSHLPVFGWAKPVPINPNRFFNFRSGVVLVSLAGPLANFLLAIICAGILYFFTAHLFLSETLPLAEKFLSQAILLNLVLAVFNLFPIPPLDGSKVLSVILPNDLSALYDSIEPYGFFIMMALIASGILGRILYPIVGTIYHLLLIVFNIAR